MCHKSVHHYYYQCPPHYLLSLLWLRNPQTGLFSWCSNRENSSNPRMATLCKSNWYNFIFAWSCRLPDRSVSLSCVVCAPLRFHQGCAASGVWLLSSPGGLSQPCVIRKHCSEPLLPGSLMRLYVTASAFLRMCGLGSFSCILPLPVLQFISHLSTLSQILCSCLCIAFK